MAGLAIATFQQPNEVGPAMLVVVEVVPWLVDAVAPSSGVLAVLPTALPGMVLPIVVLPRHGLEGAMLRVGTAVDAPRSIAGDITPDGGVVSMGLTPALPISVAPSGMLPAPESRPAVVPGVESGEALPNEDPAVEGPALHALEDIAPPSKVPMETPPAPDKGLEPDTQGAGLNPPGSIPVAPSGMPVGAPEVVALSAPRGDVAPSADVLGAVCA